MRVTIIAQMAFQQNKRKMNSILMPECECLEGDKCHCCSSPNGYEFVQTLTDALGKLEQLNSQIVSLRASLNIVPQGKMGHFCQIVILGTFKGLFREPPYTM